MTSTTDALGQYLAAIQPGDTVFRVAGGSNLDKQRVSRVTTTQIILVSGGRYSVKTGLSVGGPAWNRSNLVLPTPEVKQKWQTLYLANWASKSLPDLFKTLTAEQQVALYNQVRTLTAKSAGDHESDATV